MKLRHWNRSLRMSCLPAMVLALVALLPSWLSAEVPVDFNREIRPLLSGSCVVCHGPDENERSADLRFDTEGGSRADLGGYAAVVPGDPDSSEMIERITTEDEDLRMPPEGHGRRMTAAEVELIRRWIKQGADYARHWSYEPPQRPELPAVTQKDWARNAIDHFILSRLEAKGLRPAVEADRLTLARRLSIDLTGLPPTWEEAKAFVNDRRDNAYELYVDQLLARKTFGERWARVWLDLARYADSAGYADDPLRTIWAYRDYVIRSLNDNKPFDQFTIEQIAGDLLEDPTEEQLIATAFHRNTLTNSEGGTNDEEFRNVAIVDRVNTTMAVWMGTTIDCAQCHTHKYDPITQDEYFQFFAFFNNTEDTDKKDERPFIEIWSDEQNAEKASMQERIAELGERLKQSTPELQEAQAAWLASFRDEPIWEPMALLSSKSRARDLTSEPHGWVSANGDKPDKDDYSLRFKTTDSTLSGLRIEVPAKQKDNFVLSQVTASWTPAGTKAINARYLRVELPGDGKMIHLAELQAFSDGINVAAKGKASQSSTDFGGDVQYVNDGNTDGDYKKNSVSHTAVEKDPWVEIDLGSAKPINRIAIWNRTDGGKPISDRLKGFRVLLLGKDRGVLWQESPSKVPQPSESYSPGGTTEVPFAVALADFAQDGFPAQSVLADKVDPKKGWAVAPKQGEPHELTLVLKQPMRLAEGVLTVRINQSSQYQGHVLDHFRVAITPDKDVSGWAQMPGDIRKLVRIQESELTDQGRQELATYYREITPLLEPQRKELERIKKKLAAMKPYSTVPVMRELPPEQHRVTKVQIRGNYQNTGNEVSVGTPKVFHPLPEGEPRDRLALARWLISDDNPLTPRVIANRHWEELFGTGIVQTSEEFGSQGDLPTHPQLLDWLAVQLRESGWDLKQLLKLMVTSATYRQSATTSQDLQKADPFNRYYARGPRFRVSAEMVRDQALFVSGLLSDKMFGKPVNPPQPELGLKAAFGSATDWKTSAGADRYRRGLYTAWRRSSPYPSMAQFDAPNRETCTVRRIRTNTPLQALVTLNDPVYIEAAQALARRMIDAGETPTSRIQFAYRQCLIREANDQEMERLSRLAASLTKEYVTRPEEAKKMATQPLGDLPDGADAAEYAAWTVVGNVILNLDEIFMKR